VLTAPLGPSEPWHVCVQKVDSEFVKLRRVEVPASCVARRAAERVMDHWQCRRVHLELQQAHDVSAAPAGGR